MKALKTKKINGCFEKMNVHEILLESRISKDLIDYIGDLGKLFYNNKFDKPFFKVIVRGSYTIKGSEGNQSVRVVLPESANGEQIREICDYIEKYGESASRAS